MVILPLPDVWEGNIEELVSLTNALLPDYLPLRDSPSRVREDINARLIRHYTTQGLLDEPLKLGREARYTQRHLLQLLSLRLLMGDGLSSQALRGTLTERSDDELRALIVGERRLEVQPGSESPRLFSRSSEPPGNPALSFLAGLGLARAPVMRASPAPPAASPPQSAPSPLAAPSDLPGRPYTRIELAPGLELHIDAQARLPRTPAEQERLFEVLIRALTALRSRKK